MPKGSKWGKRETELKKEARKKGVEDVDAYVFGTMKKMGWKPSKKKKKGKK